VIATKVNAGLAESNGSLLPGLWRDSLHVTCGLTACTPGSAPGPALSNEYGKTLPLLTAYAATQLQRYVYTTAFSELLFGASLQDAGVVAPVPARPQRRLSG